MTININLLYRAFYCDSWWPHHKHHDDHDNDDCRHAAPSLLQYGMWIKFFPVNNDHGKLTSNAATDGGGCSNSSRIKIAYSCKYICKDSGGNICQHGLLPADHSFKPWSENYLGNHIHYPMTESCMKDNACCQSVNLILPNYFLWISIKHVKNVIVSPEEIKIIQSSNGNWNYSTCHKWDRFGNASNGDETTPC